MPVELALEQRIDYEQALLAIETMAAGESDALANLAQAAAVIWLALDRINWAGFYLWRQDALVLGPFQGRPACTRIAVGEGVCGSAAKAGKTLIVPDVFAFPGHIACDAASRSEIVVPVWAKGRVAAVIDVDAPVPDRFDERDGAFLERAAALLSPFCASLSEPPEA